VANHWGAGGVDFRSSERDSQWLDITFFDEEGRDLDQNARRSMEGIFTRNDFRRAFLEELGEIYYPARAVEAYTRAIEEKLDLPLIQEKKFKVVFDYGYGAASLIMPGLLGKLGCEVLSLNAFTDEKRLLTTRPPREEALGRLAEVVASFNADMGLLFDNGAETIAVVDERKEIIAGSDLLAVMTDLVTQNRPPGKVAIPVNQPAFIEEIAINRGFEVARTRVDRSSLMAAAQHEGTVFAGGGDGGFIFPDFMPVYDAMMTFARMLEMLAATGETLGQVKLDLPAYYLMRREVVTSWETKGAVMRQLLETHKDEGMDSTDGIKISWDKHRWVLILPDQEEPVLHVYAEGRNEDECREILDRHEAEIKRFSL